MADGSITWYTTVYDTHIPAAKWRRRRLFLATLAIWRRWRAYLVSLSHPPTAPRCHRLGQEGAARAGWAEVAGGIRAPRRYG
eukprot:163403-Pleurochrysis_carterae.AAC.1